VNRAGAREQAAIERVEPLVGRKEFEAAGNANGDPDCAAVELDGKSLPGGHLKVSPGERVAGRKAQTRLAPAAARLSGKLCFARPLGGALL
jgi:hypothetical protein